MAVIITTNASVNVSSLDESRSFCDISRRKSLFSPGCLKSRRLLHLNSKKSRTKVILCVNSNTKEAGNPSARDGFLGREIEFKPSFGQYLQVMESVKTERNRKKFDRWIKDIADDDGGGGGDGVSGGSKADNGVSLKCLELENDVKDVKLSENGKFSVAVPENERTRINLKEEVVGDKRSSDISKVKGRSSDGEELNLNVAKILENESLRRRSVKQGIVGYKLSSEISKVKGRSSKGEELDLNVAKSESRIQRIANEKNDLRSGELTRRSSRYTASNDDGLSYVESPAFRFSDESSEVVDKPRASRMEVEERIQKLAKGLNGADINMPEWMFSKAMRSARIRYSDHSILRLIQILGKLGNWRRVLQVIEWLQRQERFKSNKLRNIYTAALNALGKSRRPVEALNIFHAMQQQMSSYPDLLAYHSIAVTLGQAGHIKELFDVIDTMQSPPKKKFKTVALEKWDPRLKPDITVYNAVLNACVQRKQWEGAFWVLQQLRQQGQKPSAVTYGLVMEVMFACEKYNLVYEFFRKMQKSSIPNALAYRVIVNTLWKEGKTDEAIEVVREMERRGIVGSAALYYDLARCLCSAGRCHEGLKLIEKICRVASKPLVVTYTGLIQACLDSGNVQTAAYIFNQMKEFCSPNLVTCNIMLKAYLQHGLFREGRELFQKMSEDGQHIESNSNCKSRVLPDTFTFSTMLDACAKEGKWDDFEYVYRWMLHHGYHFNAKRHLQMVLEASRAGKEELIEATWEHLRQADRRPPPPLIKERLCMKLEKGDHVSAISSVTVLNKDGEINLAAFSKSAWLKLLKQNAFRFQKDSIVRLMEDANKLVRKSESSDLVLTNLLSSCIEFLRTEA